MPRQRGARELSPALLRYLALGDTAGSSAEDGHFEASVLAIRVEAFLRGRRQHADAISEVKLLFAQHHDAIWAAAAPGYAPYAASILDGAERRERGETITFKVVDSAAARRQRREPDATE